MWFSDCNAFSKMLTTSRIKRFNELFCELEHCNEDEQRKKIEEMNEIIDRMNVFEFLFIFKTKLFEKMNKMIEEKKISMKNAILLLKYIVYNATLKGIEVSDFERSSLNERFEKMIENEVKKKEKKNENLLIDLCECCIFLSGWINMEMLCVCVPCLLKAALNKEESEETQKEVEMALLALSNIGFQEIGQELYLKEITEIIEHQQKHRNLTKLAYQSAWLFFISRFFNDDSLEDTITSELHFGRETARELEELMKCVDWKRKEEEMNKEEANEVPIIKRWIETISNYFYRCILENEENVGLINSIVKVFRAAKDNYSGIRNQCIYSLMYVAENRVVKVEDLLKGKAIDAVLEGMQQPTLNKNLEVECLKFFSNVSIKLKEKNKDEKEEEERKSTKMEIFEKLEEEGYEDIIEGFHKIFNFLHRHYSLGTSLNISDYFVNV
ncbi:uncharacterized protein MONOS_17958 [Monocercomonoides exilis]|uniref:uncharacterized protein n=1 Tax=Monocercomonoides exilis TaxID=2049356 RepID=UPI00355AB382|nr:hypothetical protein MONOS_17958 [Monocercomonoides exilis]